jgi:hypothetical protein
MSRDPELSAEAVAAAGDAIVTVDQSGTITSWNTAAELLPAEGGTPSGVVGVLRPSVGAAVEFVAPSEAGA